MLGIVATLLILSNSCFLSFFLCETYALHEGNSIIIDYRFLFSLPLIYFRMWYDQ